jgi:hypothetical protein
LPPLFVVLPFLFVSAEPYCLVVFAGNGRGNAGPGGDPDAARVEQYKLDLLPNRNWLARFGDLKLPVFDRGSLRL